MRISELTDQQLEMARRNIGWASPEERGEATLDDIRAALKEAVDDGYKLEDFVR